MFKEESKVPCGLQGQELTVAATQPVTARAKESPYPKASKQAFGQARPNDLSDSSVFSRADGSCREATHPDREAGC